MQGRTRPPPPPRPHDQERRREPRLACRVRVEIVTADASTHAGTTLDLSLGGACLEMQAALAVGHRVRLRLHPPGAPQPIEAEADVRWVRDLTSGLYVAGLSLLALPTGEAPVLRQYLDTLP
jgi:c-di-GMP-binding flagellar brake protein YcgR